MRIIGICGGSGSGKSTVAACFKTFGGVILDADAIYHELVDRPSPCVNALANEFGESILKNGHIDRDALREIVFHDEHKRLKLNLISHEFVTEEIKKRLIQAEKSGAAFAVIDAPLLLEAKMDQLCDMVIAVTAPGDIRVNRITSRDGIAPEEARQRILHQIPDEELVPRCDAVIENSGDINDLIKSCRSILDLVGVKTETGENYE